MGAGGEIVPYGNSYEARAIFTSTLEDPDYVAAAASRDRLDLLHESGCLEAGLDTADTIKAENSIEQMLAHQMAAGHRAAMKLMHHLDRAMERMSVFKEDMRAPTCSMASMNSTSKRSGLPSAQRNVMTVSVAKRDFWCESGDDPNRAEPVATDAQHGAAVGDYVWAVVVGGSIGFSDFFGCGGVGWLEEEMAKRGRLAEASKHASLTAFKAKAPGHYHVALNSGLLPKVERAQRVEQMLWRV